MKLSNFRLKPFALLASFIGLFMIIGLASAPGAQAMQPDGPSAVVASQSPVECDDTVVGGEGFTAQAAAFSMAMTTDTGSFNDCVKPVLVTPEPPVSTPADCDADGTLTIPAQPEGVTGVKINGTVHEAAKLPYTVTTPGNAVVKYLYAKNAKVLAKNNPSAIYPVQAKLACGGKIVPPCKKGSAKVVTNCKRLHNAAKVTVTSYKASNVEIGCKVTFWKGGKQVRTPYTDCHVAPGKTWTKTFKNLKKGVKVTVKVAGKSWSARTMDKCSPHNPPPTGQRPVPSTGKA